MLRLPKRFACRALSCFVMLNLIRAQVLYLTLNGLFLVAANPDLLLVARAIIPFLQGGCHVVYSLAPRARQTFALAEPIWSNCKMDFIDNHYECGIPELVQDERAIRNR